MTSPHSSLPNTLVVIGTGPGIGSTTASFFAQQNRFQHVVLIARNRQQCLKDRLRILEESNNAVDVSTWSVDVTHTSEFKQVLAQISRDCRVTCVLFNAAKVAPSELFGYGEDDIVYDFMTTNTALYTTAAWAMPLLVEEEKIFKDSTPSLFVTSSLLWLEPIPQLFSLSMIKASQRNLVQSIQKTFPQIHIALLYIDGPVSVDDPTLNPPTIAKMFWELYSQKREDWVGEMTLRKEM